MGRLLCAELDIRCLQVDIVITAPLRAAKLSRGQRLSLGDVRFLVLDEADRLFQMGFLQQVDELVAACDHLAVVGCTCTTRCTTALHTAQAVSMMRPKAQPCGELRWPPQLMSQHLLGE